MVEHSSAATSEIKGVSDFQKTPVTIDSLVLSMRFIVCLSPPDDS